MDIYSELSDILRRCIERRCHQYGSAIFLAIVVGAAELYWLYRQKRTIDPRDNKKTAEKKQKRIQRTKMTIFGAVAVCIMLCVLGLSEILPAIRDLKEQRFVCVTSTYQHWGHSSGRVSFLRDGFVVIEDGSRSLDLPPNWSTEMFPYGDHYGEIWYSENSEFILLFSVLEDEK